MGGTKPMNKKQKKSENHDTHSLKGTFVSVMVLAAFIAATWLGVFVLFIARG